MKDAVSLSGLRVKTPSIATPGITAPLTYSQNISANIMFDESVFDLNLRNKTPLKVPKSIAFSKFYSRNHNLDKVKTMAINPNRSKSQIYF